MSNHGYAKGFYLLRSENILKKLDDLEEASLDVNGISTNIVKCLKGKTKSAYGFNWKYD